MAKTTTVKQSKNATGAPAQYSQSSRKGKKAWRKNVNIGEVETGLEEMRTEERVIGSSVRSRTDDELFQIDVKGDEGVRRHIPKFDKSQLSYNKSLAERSAVPAVTSRATTVKQSSLSREDKKRLLRIGKLDRKGPFNSVEDPSKLGQGSALLDPSHAVKESGKYDIWGSPMEQPISEEKKSFLLPLVEEKIVKPPKSDKLKEDIAMPAISEPHPGTSYNPPLDAHQLLLQEAHERAAEKEKELERLKGVKAQMDAARKTQASEARPGLPVGMVVGSLEGQTQDEIEEDGRVILPRPVPERKTKQQRRKAEKLLAEKRERAELAAKKRQLAALDAAKSTSKSVGKHLSEKEQANERRKALLRAKLRKSGLAGQRMGKHYVPEQPIDVQLGEDLSESLRGLKVEGNLFRDRFLSLQHRALLEPRGRVIPSKRRPQTKLVEKFAWKHFE